MSDVQLLSISCQFEFSIEDNRPNKFNLNQREELVFAMMNRKFQFDIFSNLSASWRKKVYLFYTLHHFHGVFLRIGVEATAK